MLLAIDVGNSTISAGLFDRKRELKFLASIDTDSRKTADQISIDLMNLFQPVSLRPEGRHPAPFSRASCRRSTL